MPNVTSQALPPEVLTAPLEQIACDPWERRPITARQHEGLA